MISEYKKLPQNLTRINILALSVLLLVTLLTLAQFMLLDLPSFGTSSVSFSTERTMEHLEIISQSPRSPGSLHHNKTRDYLLQELTNLGLTPTVHIAEVAGTEEKLENVLAKLSGSNSDGAILLVAHYDTESGTPGAGDNGSGTAILLEIVKNLSQTDSLRNDVIVLFSDSEELGMLGTKAFVSEHPWMSDVRLALNFDTFTFGPAFMWQTSPENGWLVHQYVTAVPQPMTNSWLYSLSRLLPLDTDLTPFIEAGVSGYNFSTSYLYPEIQTAQDRIEIVNVSSIRHAGVQGEALVHHLANIDLTQTKAPDMIYFNLWGSVVIRYPASWAMPLALITFLFLVTGIGVGIYRHVLSWQGMWQGTISFLLALLTVLLLSVLIWGAGFLIKPASFAAWIADPRHLPHDWLFFVSLIAFAIGIMAIIYQSALKKTTLPDLMIGIFFFWYIGVLVSSYYLPGASFLFVWPLLSSLILIIGLFMSQLKGNYPNRLITGAIWLGMGIMPLLLWIPFILLFFLVTAMGAFPVLVICIVLFLGILLPLFVPSIIVNQKILSGSTLLIGSLFFAVGVWVS